MLRALREQVGHRGWPCFGSGSVECDNSESGNCAVEPVHRSDLLLLFEGMIHTI